MMGGAVLDGVDYEDQGEVLARYETPFLVNFDLGVSDYFHQSDRIVIRSSCGALLCEGPFASLSYAGMVRTEFEEQRRAYLILRGEREFMANLDRTADQMMDAIHRDTKQLTPIPDYWESFVKSR